MFGLEHVFWVVVLTFVVVRAGRRGKAKVKAFYQGRVQAWKGSKPTPAPTGVKVGAALATGVVGGFLFLRGFTAGIREGWPEGNKAAREWYQRKFVDREPDMSRCPDCGVNLAEQGWPVMHKKPSGEVCKYDWQTDPRWKRCGQCNAILVPGEDECTECVVAGRRARGTTKPAQPEPASDADAGDDPQCAHDEGGKKCTHAADLANNSIYCRAHTNEDLERQKRDAQRQEPETPAIRLVHSTQTPTTSGGSTTQGGAVAVDTVTGGDVQSIEQAAAELTAITREQQAEREDAQNEVSRLEKDQAKHAAVVHWLVEQKFPAPMVARANEINARYLGRIHAAKQRIHHADAVLIHVKRAQQQLAAHQEIRNDVQRAGGMANRAAYNI